MNPVLSSSHPSNGGQMPKLVINGKFLQASTSRSGVYRVARELVMAIDRLLAADPTLAAKLDCRICVPGPGDSELRLSQIRVDDTVNSFGNFPRLSKVRAILWEQLVLPRLARRDALVSLCNIGPIRHSNAFTLVHDAQVYSSKQSYSRAFRAWYQFVLPRLGRANRMLLTVSNFSKSQLHKYGVAPQQKICVVHNGCDHISRIVPDFSKVMEANLLGKPYVVGLANTQAHKNIGILLKAFAAPALQSITLALFGPASRQQFEERGYAVPQNVRFLGFVSDEQMAGLMIHARALAFPSLTEGFGLPPLEAMSLGCPVVAAPCGALPEVCGDAALWAAPDDADEWAAQIAGLCYDDARYRELRQGGLNHALQFTWESAARRLLELVIAAPMRSERSTHTAEPAASTDQARSSPANVSAV